MEAEAWFIAQHTHFSRLDSALTLPSIMAGLGLDLLADDIEGYANGLHPV
jgi:hypothetical protein